MTSWLKNVFGGDAQVAPQEDEESLISMNRISKIFSRDEGATAATPAPEPGGGLTGRISRMFQGGGENAEPSPQRDGMLAMLGVFFHRWPFFLILNFILKLATLAVSANQGLLRLSAHLEGEDIRVPDHGCGGAYHNRAFHPCAVYVAVCRVRRTLLVRLDLLNLLHGLPRRPHDPA